MKQLKLALLTLAIFSLSGCGEPIMPGVAETKDIEKTIKVTYFNGYSVREVCYQGTVYVRMRGGGEGNFSVKLVADPNAKAGTLTQPLIERC